MEERFEWASKKKKVPTYVSSSDSDLDSCVDSCVCRHVLPKPVIGGKLR